MEIAISETNRRRKIQEDYNIKNNIIPKTITKKITEIITNDVKDDTTKIEKMSKKDKEKLIIRLESEMKEAARSLDFERAMELRDIIFELKSE